MGAGVVYSEVSPLTGPVVKALQDNNELVFGYFLGDSTLLLPSAVLLFVVALFSSRRQVAWQWALAFGVTGAIVCSSKLAFMGWGIGFRQLDFTGFSGHTALSSCFWPVFCGLSAAALRRGCATWRHCAVTPLRRWWACPG